MATAARMDKLDAANVALIEASGCLIEQDADEVKVTPPDRATQVRLILARGDAYVAELREAGQHQAADCVLRD